MTSSRRDELWTKNTIVLFEKQTCNGGSFFFENNKASGIITLPPPSLPFIRSRDRHGPRWKLVLWVLIEMTSRPVLQILTCKFLKKNDGFGRGVFITWYQRPKLWMGGGEIFRDDESIVSNFRFLWDFVPHRKISHGNYVQAAAQRA